MQGASTPHPPPAWTLPISLAPIEDAALAARLRHRIDHLTKPLGSLGRLEALMLQVGLLQGRVDPQLDQPQVVVFAADHGLAAHGVSAYPSEVTAQMVANFLAGGAAISVLAKLHGLGLTVVDAGVRAAIAPQPGLISRPIAAGTADSLTGPAMTRDQCAQALALGGEVVRSLPGNALVLGEMGIANTSAAGLIMSRLTNAPLPRCVGRGTGLDDAGLARKLAVLEDVADRHADVSDPLDVLAAFGGFEIAALTGALLQAASERRLIVVDGFIVGAALLVAHALDPAVLQSCVFAHRSQEVGHALLLSHLGVEPLLALGMRLGEGSGAALAWPLVASSVALLNGMASFDSAGVSERSA